MGFFIAFAFSIFGLPKFMAWAISKKAQQPINTLPVPNHAK